MLIRQRVARVCYFSFGAGYFGQWNRSCFAGFHLRRRSRRRISGRHGLRVASVMGIASRCAVSVAWAAFGAVVRIFPCFSSGCRCRVSCCCAVGWFRWRMAWDWTLIDSSACLACLSPISPVAVAAAFRSASDSSSRQACDVAASANAIAIYSSEADLGCLPVPASSSAHFANYSPPTSSTPLAPFSAGFGSSSAPSFALATGTSYYFTFISTS